MKRVFILLSILILSFSGSLLAKEAKDILEKVKPSVVKVIAEGKRNYVVSGFAVAPEYVLTSRLFAKYPYKKVRVISTDGKAIEAEAAGSDKSTGLFLLKLKGAKLKPVRIGKDMAEGEWIAAVGSFFNKMPAIAQGIVTSAADSGYMVNLPTMPGAPGSGLFNKDGELVAFLKGPLGFTRVHDYKILKGSAELVVKSDKKRVNNMSLGIPADRVVSVYRELKKYGKVRRGWLGIELDGLNPVQNVIASVTADSPADKSGIKAGDKLVEINSTAISSRGDIVKSLGNRKPGEKLEIAIIRENRRKNYNVVLGEKSNQAQVTMSISADSMPLMKEFTMDLTGTSGIGAEFLTLTPYAAESFGVKGGLGVVVSKVHDNIGNDNLRVFDVVVEASGKKVSRPHELEEIIRTSNNKVVELKCIREGKPVTLTYSVKPSEYQRLKQQKLREFFTIIADKAGMKKPSVSRKFWFGSEDSKATIDRKIELLEKEKARINRQIEELKKLKRRRNRSDG